MKWQVFNIVAPLLGYYAGMHSGEISAVAFGIAAGLVAGIVGVQADRKERTK